MRDLGSESAIEALACTAARWMRSLRLGSRCAATCATGALLLLLPAQAQAPIDARVALIIGNAAYAAAPLLNPANDAKAVSDTLKGMGFAVVDVRDGSKAQMEAAISEAGHLLKGRNGVGLLYYAGHGLQLDWRNYMVPVDARLARASDVAAQTVDLQQVIDAFKAAGNRMNIVVLDACRDNPFAATASGKGLAPMDAPPGTYLAYATAPGNVAEDGTETSGNGLYTQYLVRELKEPGTKIEDIFKRVRFEVRRHSQGRQVPWESTSLEDDFYFDPKVRPVKLADAVRAREVADALARESADWGRVKDSKQPDDFYAFLQKYPNGLISEQAQFRLDQLQKAKVQAQPGANGVVALASGTNRYAKGDEFVYDEIDGFTKTATRFKRRVTFADAERVEFGNRGGLLLDQMGGVLRNGIGSKEPADLTTPAELAVGKRWRSAFTNTAPDGTTSANYWDAKVMAFEEVVVPAGRFMAFRIERVGQARPSTGAMSNLTATYWVDPTTMLEVRTDRLHRREGKITTYDSRQLVRVTRAPRPAGP
jgi:hypothetical protein